MATHPWSPVEVTTRRSRFDPRRSRWSLRLLVVALIAALPLVAACGGDDDSPATRDPDQTITVQAVEFDFVSDVVPDITEGDTVRFVVENAGAMVHEAQFLDAQGQTLDRTPRLAPGESAEVVITFADAGIYQIICDIDDHLSLGQRVLFQVAER